MVKKFNENLGEEVSKETILNIINEKYKALILFKADEEKLEPVTKDFYKEYFPFNEDKFQFNENLLDDLSTKDKTKAFKAWLIPKLKNYVENQTDGREKEPSCRK